MKNVQQVTIVIDTDNDAFSGDYKTELARILAELSKRYKQGYEPGVIADVNGNTVGKINYK